MAWRIKTVTERTGVPAETLRSWERRYAVVRPARGPSGYRQYSDADVELLCQIKALVDSGLAVSEAIARCQRETPAPPDAPPGPLRDARHALLRSLLDLDERAAEEQLAGLIALGWEPLLARILLPVGREAEFLRTRGDCSPGEAAFCRGWLRRRIAAMAVALGPGPTEAPLCLTLRLPGGSALSHGALSLGLRLRGWRVLQLDEPLDLVDAAPLVARAAPRTILLCVDPKASAERQRTDLARLEALAAGVTILAHGAAAGGLPRSVQPAQELAELPNP